MGSQTEHQKMLAGELYDANDPELMKLRTRARKLISAYNQLSYDKAIRQKSISDLIGEMWS